MRFDINHLVYELSLKHFSLELFSNKNYLRMCIYCKKEDLYIGENYEVNFGKTFDANYDMDPSLIIKNILTLFSETKCYIYSTNSDYDDECSDKYLEKIVSLFCCQEELIELDKEHRNTFMNHIDKLIKQHIIDIEILESKKKEYSKLNEYKYLEKIVSLFCCQEELIELDKEHRNTFMNHIDKLIKQHIIDIEILESKKKEYNKLNEYEL